MTTLQAKITSKGQVTLPKELRDLLALRTGDRLEFSLEQSNKIAIRKKRLPGSSTGCAQKFLKPGQKPLALEEIDNAIRQHMRQKYGTQGK